VIDAQPALRYSCSSCGAPRKGPSRLCTACLESGNYIHSFFAVDALLGRVAAGKMALKAVKAGTLPSPTLCRCVDCGNAASLYEHRDYNKPLDVVPACRACNTRRGPAIPLRGSIRRLVELGFVPYTTRSRVAQLLASHGIDTSPLDHLPKRLTHAAWVELLPAFDALDALGETA
jgi:hypothetical protein